MVLLLNRLSLFNHRHTPSKLDSDQPLLSFQSHVTTSLLRLSPPPSPGSLSLKWLRKCIHFLHSINKAFANLVVAIDYPANKWEADTVDEYLNYTLHFLNLLNCITSSLSHFSQKRTSVAHALSLISAERLNVIRWNDSPFNSEFKLDGIGKNRSRVCSGKEYVIHQALLVMESAGLWVCGIVLLGLTGDDSVINEARKLVDCSTVESVIGRVVVEKGVVVKEVREVNESLSCVAYEMSGGNCDFAAAAVMEVERRLKGIEDEVRGIGDEVDDLFSKVMVGRNELLESLRRRNK